jgi:hypothetical protein
MQDDGARSWVRASSVPLKLRKDPGTAEDCSLEKDCFPSPGPAGGDRSDGELFDPDAGRRRQGLRRAAQRSSRGPDQNASPTVTVRAISAWWRSE